MDDPHADKVKLFDALKLRRGLAETVDSLASRAGLNVNYAAQLLAEMSGPGSTWPIKHVTYNGRPAYVQTDAPKVPIQGKA